MWNRGSIVASSEGQTGTALVVYQGYERRIDERAGTDQPILVRSETGDLVAELLDLSASGAKLRIREGMCPPVGEDVKLVLLDKTEFTGAIARIDGTAIGVAFDVKLLQPEDYLHHDHLGFDYYRIIQRLQSRRVRSA